MTLRQKQSKFARMIPLLILFAYEKGYEITFGDFYAKTGHRKWSFHYRNGRFLRSTKSHEPLGIFWESMGGTWGGRFGRKDGNHYSLGEKR